MEASQGQGAWNVLVIMQRHGNMSSLAAVIFLDMITLSQKSLAESLERLGFSYLYSVFIKLGVNLFRGVITLL